MRSAAVVWLLGGLIYLGAEAVAASGYPGYSYADDYISDLGVPNAVTAQGRSVDGHVAMVMNAGFVLHGLCFLAAPLLVRRAAAVTVGKAFLALATVNALGNFLIATFHAGRLDGTGAHTVGAGMAIVGGNLAVLVAGRTARRSGAPQVYARVCTALGIIGLLALATLLLGLLDLPVGVLERVSVYTIIGWELVTGAALLRVLRRRSPVPAWPARGDGGTAV